MAPAKTVSANDVPMHGNGFYSPNSALQRSAMLSALPLLAFAAAGAAQAGQSQRPFTALEFGSAHGNNSNNSHQPFATILESHQLPTNREIQLIFNDRPANDSHALSTNLSTMTWPAAAGNTVDVAFSLLALHHLDRVTPVPREGPIPTHEVLQAELRAQAYADLLAFLKHRAREIVPGGGLVLSLVRQELGPNGEEMVNYAAPVNACRSVWIEMLQQGVLNPAVANVFEVLAYNRTMADVQRTLAESAVGEKWTVEEVFERCVLHPAMEEVRIRKNKSPEEDEAHTTWYAKTVVDWLMAVVAGYFVKALKDGMGIEEPKVVDALLKEWVDRTTVKFLESHRDEEVPCWFVYARLNRK
ncbi:S-adenosyl-L-methionine-dependent methyltransferase [Aspergillus homomorphus CBS 101889]|uniref:S-adenosyl-L-methionine-dependent methyltransferase n=1 Tax=Aspergillus homomorphus (strain CBS 101889) TaxID=1450537 RepID=A0A395HJB2_ASPHC|nr:S-adenosyl-L-methionine-dependent methyltransferase [Aspergillus homomorphus CBS 101889]RAL07860.1 S-adenosyl-L-methionine-dependent methyltransferase [Aspergillus homomorphus CBS 101889]